MPVKIPGVKIDFYGRSFCSDCVAAQEVFKEVDVGFNYKDVRADQEANTEATAICKSLGRELSVPVIVISHRTETINSKIIFIEPRELGLRALADTLLALRK